MEKQDQFAALTLYFAENFIAHTNRYFLDYVATLPEDEVSAIKLNLLSGDVTPKKIDGFIMKQTINVHKTWFLSELKKRGVKQEEVKDVCIEVTCKHGNLQRKNYTCHVTLHANGKEYSQKVLATYS